MLGARAHLPVRQLRGPEAAQELQGEATTSSSRESVLQPLARSLGRDSREEMQVPSAGVVSDKGGEGSERGRPTQTPTAAILTSTEWKRGRPPQPSLAPGALSSPPSLLAPSPVLLGGREAPKARRCTLEQAVAMVSNANPLSPLETFQSPLCLGRQKALLPRPMARCTASQGWAKRRSGPLAHRRCSPRNFPGPRLHTSALTRLRLGPRGGRRPQGPLAEAPWSPRRQALPWRSTKSPVTQQQAGSPPPPAEGQAPEQDRVGPHPP